VHLFQIRQLMAIQHFSLEVSTICSTLSCGFLGIKPLTPSSGLDNYRSLVLDMTSQILFPMHLLGTKPRACILDLEAPKPPCSRSNGWHYFMISHLWEAKHSPSYVSRSAKCQKIKMCTLYFEINGFLSSLQDLMAHTISKPLPRSAPPSDSTLVNLFHDSRLGVTKNLACAPISQSLNSRNDPTVKTNHDK
jgi:hypothetical protein